MGIIQLNLQPHATKQDIQDAITAINKSLPPEKAATEANVIENLDGSIAKVEIGTAGDVTAAEHLAARDAAVTGNPGVASASFFPRVGNTDFESGFTAGDDLKNTDLILGQNVLTLSHGQNGKIEVTSPTDALSGSFSLAGVPDPSAPSSTGHNNSYQIIMTASKNGLSRVGAYEVSFKFKDSDPYGGIARDEGDTFHRVNLITGEAMDLKSNTALFGPNWILRDGRSGVDLDTGIPVGDLVHLSLIKRMDGTVTLTELISGVTSTFDRGFVRSATQIFTTIQTADNYAVAQTQTGHGNVFDDLVFNILSGS